MTAETYIVVTVHAHAFDLIHPILIRIDAYCFGLSHICRNELKRDQGYLDDQYARLRRSAGAFARCSAMQSGKFENRAGTKTWDDARAAVTGDRQLGRGR